MSLVPSLLQAIVRVDGEALVMHVGEKPYVISPSGQVDLAAKGLTLDAVTGIVAQLLPADAMKALDDLGAVQHVLAPLTEFPGERFTVTAARGGDDIWAEIRRRHVVDDHPAAIATLAPQVADDAADALSLPPEEQLWPAPAYAEERPELTPMPAEPMFEAIALAVEPVQVPAGPTGVTPIAAVAPAAPIPTMAPVAPVPTAVPIAPIPTVAPVAPMPTAVPVAPTPAAVTPIDDGAPVEPSLWATKLGAHDRGKPSRSADLESERVVEWTFDPTPSDALDADALWANPLGSATEATGGADGRSTLEIAAGLLLTSEPLAAAAAAPMTVPRQPERHVVPVAHRGAIGGREDVSVPAPLGPEPRAVAPAAPGPVPTAVESGRPPSSERPQTASPTLEGAAGPVSLGVAAPFIFDREAFDREALNREAAPRVPGSPVARADRPGISERVPESPMPTQPAVSDASPSFVPFVPAAPAASYPAVVLPIDRGAVRVDASWNAAESGGALERMLRTAVSRGASVVYLSSNAKVGARIDGEVQSLDSTPVLGPSDVEAMLLAVLPERHGAALRAGQPSEWVWDLSEIGRIRCSIFNDHRGPGAVLRVVTARALSADQLGLSREVQALAAEPEGLVLVSGPRGAGKSTLMASLVDLINRSRRDYVIAFEREINIVHERNAAFVSQREIRGSADDLATAARAALREDPDVLVFDELMSAPVMDVAIEAVQAGRLVIAGIRAPHLGGAVDRIVEMHVAERRRQVLSSLAQCLRAVVTQVLVKKSAGGRVAAREVLFNSPIVASVLAEGKTSQLTMAIEGGRRQGMQPLNDALAALVQSQGVDVREAYRCAIDRAGLLDVLQRQGIDTSFVERLA